MNTERLRELAEAATPGPWNESWRNRQVPGIYSEENEWTDVAEVFADADVRFIAAANPQTVLALLDELEASRRGQGRAPAPAKAGPVRAPLHETHPIPDSTKEGTP